MPSYDAFRSTLANPSQHDDIGEEHERLCCDEHYLHHMHGEHGSEEWPVGGCWTCEAIVLRTVRCLAANLRIAAGLCSSYWHGVKGAAAFMRPPLGVGDKDLWQPGCNRSAPTWNTTPEQGGSDE